MFDVERKMSRARMKRRRMRMKRYETETSSSIPKEIPSLDQKSLSGENSCFDKYFDRYWNECCEGDKQNG